MFAISQYQSRLVCNNEGVALGWVNSRAFGPKNKPCTQTNDDT
jgi:hypothetical protein